MQNFDPSQNFIVQQKRALDAVFRPNTIAVIGAKDEPGSVGRTILSNLQSDFKGKIFPVNPKRSEVLGLPCYPTISKIPEKVDLAIIVTKASVVPQIVEECVKAETKAAIVISAGFKELGKSGLELEKKILEIAKKGSLPIIGPNCLGVINPIYGLNATFAKGMALPGNIAFLSQSGAMCTAVLDWSFKEKIGFSAFVSVGSMADIGWGELIDYLGSDPKTESILMYMETVGDPRSFLSAAREIALEKPIIVIKAGKSLQAAQAAASHTGALAGSDEVFDAALERVGVLRVDTISDLFQIASVLSRQPRPKGPKLSIITNAGGPAVLATDSLILNGADLAPLSSKTLNALNSFLPDAWSHNNPIDVLGDASAERYSKTVELIAHDPESDGLLVILAPQDVTDPTSIAEVLKNFADLKTKPLLASWMGGLTVEKGIEILAHSKIPTFNYPDEAAAAFARLWRYNKNLSLLYQTPIYESSELDADFLNRKIAKETIDFAKKEKRELLNEFESKKILSAYGIPIVETEIAISEDEAVTLANKIGYPIVVKLFSKTITHKSDIGGVKLNLKNSEEVRSAFKEIQKNVFSKASPQDFHGVSVQKMVKLEGYELILGSSLDVQFGHIILFGMGGQLVEVFKDRSIGLPPLNKTLARFLIEKTKIYEALKGVRGKKAIDLSRLEEILVRFSRLIVENPRIKECDINPLLASPEGFLALDARILIHTDLKDNELPKLAIRPYPTEYVETFKLKNGLEVLLRPIMPEDEPLVSAFHKELSENSVRQRYFEFISLDKRIAHERLIRICFNDYDRELAIVAQVTDSKGPQIIGISRLSRLKSLDVGQLTMIISDAYHNQGLGSKLIQHLLSIAKKEDFKKISANILFENEGMIKICKKSGFELHEQENSPIVRAEINLGV